MSLHNASYQHYEGRRRGIWYRRSVIMGYGLKQGKWVRRLVVASWCTALAQVALLFLIGQLLVPDSLIVRHLDKLNPQLREVANGLMAWLEMHPEVSVRSTENFMFYHFSRFYVPLVMLVLALAVPQFISRDLASNALPIYTSKALSTFDYLLGKIGSVWGLLCLTWLGPVCFAWLLGNLLAPHWHFFWHSRFALGHTLVFVVTSMAVLSGLALGVSALSGREKVPVGLWLGLWLMGRFLASQAMRHHGALPGNEGSWMEHLSITYNLDQIAAATFRLTNDLQLAQERIPLLGSFVGNLRSHRPGSWESPDLAGALVGLGLMLLAAVIIVKWKVKPE
jgi:ABC-2 type transport system permease protein